MAHNCMEEGTHCCMAAILHVVLSSLGMYLISSSGWISSQLDIWPLVTARQAAVLATAIPSVHLSVCPSVTCQYWVKTTAHSTVQFALSDSKMCLVF